MKKFMFLLLLIFCLGACDSLKKDTSTAIEPQALEFGSMKYGDICHNALTQLANGDMDSFINNFAENVIYRFNSGDSIVGKTAVAAYWKDRRTNVIDQLEFTNDLWLPLKVNDSEQGVRQGMWVLGWYKATSTYKTGKSMNQFIHTLYHFDSNDKVDEVIQYLDRLPIQQANIK
jgi:ketosteroid isomerase-like protein